MLEEKIIQMRDAHEVLYEFPFELKELTDERSMDRG
jgi:hypothetical protein